MLPFDGLERCDASSFSRLEGNSRTMEGTELAIRQRNLVEGILQLQCGQAVLNIHVANRTTDLLLAAFLQSVICLIIGDVVTLEHGVCQASAAITLKT